MSSRHALVLGATGLIGTRCVEHLLASSAYSRVTCIVRRPLGKTSDKLVARVVDFSRLTPSDVDPEADLFCAIGTTMKKAKTRENFREVDFAIPLRVAELAVQARTKRIALVSSVGADARSHNFYLRTKGELEEALAKLPLLAFHVLRPSLLMGERAERRPGEAMASVVMRAAASLLGGGLRKYRAIDGDDVARALVAAMLGPDPDPPRNVYEHDEILRLSARM
ncbi:MAG TPA: NAD-dependent epimerase/dehydratase family protein [Labilithrix sp.]|nr:NAD-dependent epimerase/dehydratase family protein [Labilithrix sp.]